MEVLCFLVHVLVYHFFLPTSYAFASSDHYQLAFSRFLSLAFFTSLANIFIIAI